MTRTALYRHFDASGALLYVGISKTPSKRLGEHDGSSHWSDQIATMTIQWFENRDAARAAETEAIASENPAHNSRRPQPQPAALAVGGDLTLLFAKIDMLAEKRGISATQVVRNATGNPRLYERLKARYDLLVADVARIDAYIDGEAS